MQFRASGRGRKRLLLLRERMYFKMSFLSYFFVKKYLLVGASSMLWTGQWISESVRDVCMSHQSDRIYYKQPIKFIVSYKGNLIFLFFTRSKFN